LHEGYTIDFVDDIDIISGFLKDRRYLLLYITAPNVSNLACQTISQWVNEGGTVVVTAGAATLDEYNIPSQLLDDTLGMTSRKPHRGVTYYYGGLPANSNLVSPTLSALPPILADSSPALNNNGAQSLYDFDTGEAGVTLNQYGNGKAFLFNFLPGVQYFNARYDLPLGHRIALTTKWRSEYREFALLPLQYIQVPRLVTINGYTMVEAVRMESAVGMAIILFNWNNVPLKDINISLTVSAGYTKVVSALGISVNKIQIKPNSIQFTLKKLEYVDVVVITT
jgi:hypothetical protein